MVLNLGCHETLSRVPEYWLPPLPLPWPCETHLMSYHHCIFLGHQREKDDRRPTASGEAQHRAVASPALTGKDADAAGHCPSQVGRVATEGLQQGLLHPSCPCSNIGALSSSTYWAASQPDPLVLELTKMLRRQ